MKKTPVATTHAAAVEKTARERVLRLATRELAEAADSLEACLKGGPVDLTETQRMYLRQEWDTYT